MYIFLRRCRCQSVLCSTWPRRSLVKVWGKPDPKKERADAIGDMRRVAGERWGGGKACMTGRYGAARGERIDKYNLCLAVVALVRRRGVLDR